MAQEQNKVLIIDDEVDLTLLLQNYLTRKGYQTDIRHTIAEGTAALRELHPAIIFLDNNLPDGTGWDIAPQLAIDYPDMFIFLISAFHPNQPAMPDNSKFVVVEKPVSISAIDRIFAERFS